jgi:hypothetical protein
MNFERVPGSRFLILDEMANASCAFGNPKGIRGRSAITAFGSSGSIRFVREDL